MKFEWDDSKNRRNFEKHGIDFEDAAELFRSMRVTFVDSRANYGEVRKISIGRIGVNICVVVYTERDETMRIISARRANARERKKFYEFIEGRENEEA